jgi:hypothetical protein
MKKTDDIAEGLSDYADEREDVARVRATIEIENAAIKRDIVVTELVSSMRGKSDYDLVRIVAHEPVDSVLYEAAYEELGQRLKLGRQEEW